MLCAAGALFAQARVAEADRDAIWQVLDEIGQAMVREDLDSILVRLSPNMDAQERYKIKEALKEKFRKYDYTEYRFSPPDYKKIEVIDPDEKLKFTVTYSEKYKGVSSSGSSSGLWSNFVIEKIDGEWLVLNTDFYTKERALKTAGVFFGSFMFLFMLAGAASFIFWLMMLLDCVKRDFAKPNDKVIWVLVIIFIQAIGALIYYFVVKKKSQ